MTPVATGPFTVHDGAARLRFEYLSAALAHKPNDPLAVVLFGRKCVAFRSRGEWVFARPDLAKASAK